jgi:hypothetical protein
VSEEQLRKMLREVSPEVWAHAMERLFSDRLSAGGYWKDFSESPRLRILCAWKDLKEAANELNP